jgi:hypothetical protein
MHRLFRGFNVLSQLVRSVLPALPGAAVVLLLRLVGPEDRDLPLALGELLLYGAVTIAFTMLLERRLITELFGYLRGRGGASPIPRPTADPA